MLRFSAAILLFIGFAGVLAPRTAMASCGDWLAHPVSVGETVKINGDADSVAREISTPEAPSRCNGPLCKRSPSQNVPSPASPTNDTLQQKIACRCVSASDNLFLGVALVADSDILLPGENPFGIDRPPQS